MPVTQSFYGFRMRIGSSQDLGAVVEWLARRALRPLPDVKAELTGVIDHPSRHRYAAASAESLPRRSAARRLVPFRWQTGPWSG